MVILLLACPSPSSDSSSKEDSVDTVLPGDSGDTEFDSEDTDTGPPMVDLDGDGYSPPEDCHDQNPFIHPGAEEYCDAVDQDCDGEPLAPGVCAKTAPVEAAYAPLYIRNGSVYPFAVTAPDAGAGGVVLGVCNATCVDDEITSGVYRNVGRVDELPLFPAGATFTFDHYGGSSQITLPTDPGDVTGDGIPDLAVLDETGVVGYAVFPGPIADGAHLTYDDAYLWRVPEFPTPGMASARTGGDVDGDTVNDLAMFSLDALSHRSEFAILFGHDGGDSDMVLIDYDRDVVIGGMSFAQDFDGDGMNDLFMNGFELGWISGAQLRSLDGSQVDDVMTTTFARNGESPGGYRYATPNVAPLGDLDEDGYPEVALAEPGSSFSLALYGDKVGELFVISPAGALGAVELDDHATSVMGPNDEYVNDFCKDVYVLTGPDGRRAMVWFDDHRDGWLLPTTFPGLHTEFADVQSVAIESEPNGYDVTYLWDVGPDLTGDGVGDYSAQSQEFTTEGFVPGFIPPWDDPTYW